MSKSSKPKGGLGRGLDALIPKAPIAVEKPTKATPEAAPSALEPANTLAMDRLVPNKNQPRTQFDDATLIELANSIREKGILQPLLVRPKGKNFEIVAGERRWRAAKIAGLKTVPVVIRELSDRETLEIAIVENLQREDLGPVEEARAFQKLIEFGMTQEEAAQAVGKSRPTVTNALRLLSLPEAALAALETGRISAGHARAILAVPKEHQDWALAQILERHLSVRLAEDLKRESEVLEETAKAPAPKRASTHHQLQIELQRHLGTRLKIVGDEKGKIEIPFYSHEDLTRLLEIFGYQS